MVGDHLQELSLPDLLVLRVALSQYILGRWLVEIDYPMGRAIEECWVIDDEGQYCYTEISDWLPAVLATLDGMTADSADSLINAITDRIREIGPNFRQQAA